MAEINKVILGGQVRIDLTSDTVTADKLSAGFTAHDRSGAVITGTNTFDADSSAATARSGDVLSGKSFAAGGSVLNGSMADNGAYSAVISDKNETKTIPAGYHSGSGGVSIAPAESAKLIPENIKSGVTLLGVSGSCDTAQVTAQVKTAVPSAAAQSVLPDAGYDYLERVDIQAIPYSEQLNEAGGLTVTIG